MDSYRRGGTGLSHHKEPQGARVEARPTLVRGVDGKRYDVKQATKIPAASGVPTLSTADEPRNPEEKEEMRKFP